MTYELVHTVKITLKEEEYRFFEQYGIGELFEASVFECGVSASELIEFILRHKEDLINFSQSCLDAMLGLQQYCAERIDLGYDYEFYGI